MADGPDARARLTAAAGRSFAERGFSATTTRDIAARAGMSPAAVYVHHSSKEELLFLISRDGHDAALRVVTAAAASSEDPGQQLWATVREFALWHAVHHSVARVVQYEGCALSREHHALIASRRRAIEQVLRDVIEFGVQRGDFHCDDVPGTTMAILSLVVDVARWYRDGGPRTPDQIADLYAELALRMVGHQPQPRTTR